MKIATYMPSAPKSAKGTPRAENTYRAFRRNFAKDEYRYQQDLGNENDPTIRRPTWRPKHRNAFPHQSTREMTRRVRRGLAPVAVALAAE